MRPGQSRPAQDEQRSEQYERKEREVEEEHDDGYPAIEHDAAERTILRCGCRSRASGGTHWPLPSRRASTICTIEARPHLNDCSAAVRYSRQMRYVVSPTRRIASASCASSRRTQCASVSAWCSRRFPTSRVSKPAFSARPDAY